MHATVQHREAACAKHRFMATIDPEIWRIAALRADRKGRNATWVQADLWIIGDGLPPGARKRILTELRWVADGGCPGAFGRFYVAGCLARRFPPTLRRLNVGPSFHQAVAHLPDERALPLLD